MAREIDAGTLTPQELHLILSGEAHKIERPLW